MHLVRLPESHHPNPVTQDDLIAAIRTMMEAMLKSNPMASAVTSGSIGSKGDPGLPGEKGEKGDRGDVGTKGDIGEQGLPGLKGDKGDQGLSGLKGDRGDQGLQGLPGLGGYRNLVTLNSDVSSAATLNFADITGLSFPVLLGVNYRFFGLLVYTASATTIGLRVSLTVPNSTILSYITRTTLGLTGSAANSWVNAATTGDAGIASTSSVSTAGNIMIIEGFIRPSALGTVQLRFAPETATAGGIVIKAGSTLEYW